MASNLKKAFGIMNKKKSDQNSDEEACAYTDPTILHATDPPLRNHRGISHPHYPPPRPQHSPNPRRKNHDQATQGNKRAQTNDNIRNSSSALNSGEPKRAPPRPCPGKKSEEDDYCDPIDVQRKDDFIPEKSNRPKDDYCEPWDSTTKSDFGKKLGKKTSQSDDEHNEYMDPYDTGKDGVIEKRMSRGLGKEFAVLHVKPSNNEQQKNDQVFEPSRKSGSLDDYDTPWEWKKQAQFGKIKIQAPKPAAQNQRAKPGGGPSDDYDEPWEKKQGYFKAQLPASGGKPRSPVPLPRMSHQPTDTEGIYDRPWDPSQANDQSNVKQPEAGGVYATPWEDNPSGNEMNGHQKSKEPSSRRSSQPAVLPSSVQPTQNRKFSQPLVADSANYDTPWEYKTPKQFSGTAPPKPSRLDEECQECEVNPDLPLDDQSWYHGPLKRLEAEDLLRDAQDCSFLVRNSESSKKDFSLSMKNNENFLHLRIVRQLDGQYILGQFSKPFMDIPKVIHHYSRNKLNIRGAEHKFLKHPINIQPEYHTIEPEDDSHL